MTLFANEAVNKGRQIELDIARGLAVLFMVLIHLQEYFSNTTTKESVIGSVIDFHGGIPAAPVFMVLMGIGIVYSRKSTAETFYKRGLILIGLGYVLNLLRGSLPQLFLLGTTGVPDYLEMTLSTFIYVDIFHFSGLAMLFFGAVKQFNISNKTLFIILVGFFAANVMLSEIYVESTVLKAVTGLLWGSNEYAFFPFLTWIFYPIIGYLFGKVLIRVQNKDLFYGGVTVLGVVLFIGVLWLQQYTGFESYLFDDEAYYHHLWADNILAAFYVFGWLGLLYFVNKFLTDVIRKPLIRWSKNVTEIYFIHWILIGWMVPFLGYETLSMPYFIVLMIFVYGISDALADYYQKVSN